MCFQKAILHSELKHLKKIGQGGFGFVYKAKHARLGTVIYKELIAVKLGDRYLKFQCDCIYNYFTSVKPTTH